MCNEDVAAAWCGDLILGCGINAVVEAETVIENMDVQVGVAEDVAAAWFCDLILGCGLNAAVEAETVIEKMNV